MKMRTRLTVLLVLLVSGMAEADPEPRALPDGTVRLGAERFRHPDPVREVTFSPDGKLLASADAKGRVRVWEVDTGALRRAFPEKTGTALAFSPDSKFLATAGTDRDTGTLQVWSVDDGKQWLSVKRAWYGPLAFTPDGLGLACSDGTEVVLVNADTGAEVRRFKGLPRSPLSVAVSGDGKWIATGAEAEAKGDSAIIVWDAATGKPRCTITDPKQGRVRAVAFSPDGTKLASATPARATLWNPDTGASLGTFGDDAVDGVAFNRTGTLLVTAGDISLIDTLKNTVRWLGPRGTADRVAIAPDGTLIAIARPDDGRVRLLAARSGEELPLTAHTREIVSVTFSPNGKLIATNSASFFGDDTIRLWDAGTGVAVRTLRYDRSRFRPVGKGPVAFSADGTALITGEVRWDVASGRESRAPWKADYNDWILSPDGLLVAVAKQYDNRIELIDSITGRQLFNLDEPKSLMRFRYDRGGAIPLAFSPDGKKLVVTLRLPNTVTEASPPLHTLALFDTKTGNHIRSFRLGKERESFACAFSADGSRIAVRAAVSLDHLAIADGGIRYGSVELFDTDTGTLLGKFDHSPASRSWRGRPFALSPDGRLLATGGRDNAVAIWEALSGKPVATFTGHTEPPLALAFSPDGRHLVSGSAGGDAIVWPVSLPKKRTIPPEK
jgi:WD40 repeat protein